MKNLLSCVVVLALASASGECQQPRSNMPTPPERMDTGSAPQTVTTPPRIPKADLAQLQKEADDLARTAQTIPADLTSVRRGMLPKDVIAKLKQIEKLSKHLRSELNR